MSDGSTLLVTPCELPTKDHTALKPNVSSGMKRRNSDRAVLNCLTPDVVSPQTCMPNRKKFRQCIGLCALPSKVIWDKNLIYTNGDAPSICSGYDEAESGNSKQSAESRNEKWYSKAEYKQMMLDQCLTVHIMRSLRSLAGEKVPTDYCDELDYNSCRFDNLIKKHSIDSEEYCERGLESYLSDERRNGINTTRKLHKLLVMSEYDRQGTSGTFDSELVRKASLTYSKKSSVRARKLALFDQREAQANNNINNPNDDNQKQDSCQHNPRNQCNDSMMEEKVICPDLHSSKAGVTNRRIPFFSTPENNMLVKGMKKSNPFEQNHRHESQFSSERIRETLMKQHLMHLILKQEQEQNQRAQSRYHFQRNHLNSTLQTEYPPRTSDSMASSLIATFKTQGQNQRYHHPLQLQIQDQCNHRQHVQRLLLLLQHQQHSDAIHMPSA